MQAQLNPAVWPLARLLDGVRRTDPAVEQSWQDRLDRRLDGCRAMIARLVQEGRLRTELSANVATDLLWTLTSMRMWEDLVVLRGWRPAQYVEHVYAVIVRLLVSDDDGVSAGTSVRGGARRTARRTTLPQTRSARLDTNVGATATSRRRRGR